MPPPVSTVGICLVGYAALNACARGGNTISPEANSVRKAATALVESVELSEALFGQKAAVISQLYALGIECGEDNWDGNGAAAIDPKALANAVAFVRALPRTLPLPEVAPEPDGAVSLDWHQSRTRIFSLSVGASERLAYAWLDGGDRGHGVAPFDGNSIPSRVAEGIRGIMNYGDLGVGAF